MQDTMTTNPGHVFTNSVQTDNQGNHAVPGSDHQNQSGSGPSFFMNMDNRNDLHWLLAAVAAVLASVLGLWYIAPGFLAGLLAGAVFIVVGQVGAFWIVWEKVKAKRDGNDSESINDASTPSAPVVPPVLERQASVSHEGYVWIATKPAAIDWPKSSQRGGKGPLSPPGWAPQKRHAKLHFNMLMLGGPNEEKTVVKLDGCNIRAVSANGGPERKWSKKFPISIQHSERTLFSNSHELLIYCATGFEKESWCHALRHAARLHVPEEPSLLKTREDYLAFVDLVRQLAGGGEDWLASDTPGRDPGSNSGIGKWRARLRRRSKGKSASWGSADEAAGRGVVSSPGARGLSPPRKGDSDTEDSAKKQGGESGSKPGGPSRVRSFLEGRKLTFRRKKRMASDVGERSQGSSMGDSVLSEDDVSDAGGLLSGDDFSAGEDSGRKSGFAVEALGVGGAEEGEDLTEGKVEGDNIIRFGKRGGQERVADLGQSHDGGIRFCNVMFARVFFDMARNTQVADMIKGRIERKLARLETPTFMGSLRCTHFDLGTKPPLARAMRVLPSTQGVSVEVDFEYRGGAKLTFETRLDMRAYANTGLFKNLSDKPGAAADKAEELVENAELLAAGVASKGLEQGGEMLDALGGGSGKPTGRKLKGNFHSAMTNVLARLKPVVQHVTEQVSMVPLTLTVTVLGLEGTARLRLGPPPTDRLWFGFSDMPDLELESRPSVGQLNITRNPLAAWMVERLRNLLRESLVFPQGEDITIPYMMNDPDELYQGEPPPAWKRTASDVAPPVSTPLANPGFPAPGTPTGINGSPGGGVGTPAKVGGAQSPGQTIPHPDMMRTPPRGGGQSHSPAAVIHPPAAFESALPAPAGNVLSSADSPGRSTMRTAPDRSPIGGASAAGGFPYSSMPGEGAPTAGLAAGAGGNSIGVGKAVGEWEAGTGAGHSAGPLNGTAAFARATASPTTGQTPSPGSLIAAHPPAHLNLLEGGKGPQVGSSASVVTGGSSPGPAPGAVGSVRTPEPQNAEKSSFRDIESARGDLGSALVPPPVTATEEPLAAIGEGNENGTIGREKESGAQSSVEREHGWGGSTGDLVEPRGKQADNVAITQSTHATTRDPFPAVDVDVNTPLRIDGEGPRHVEGHPSPQKPHDPWDLVAQAETPFPRPAAPYAFRNRPLEQPGTSSQVGSARTSTLGVGGRVEGSPVEEEDGSGSERSLEAGSRGDVGANNRKVQMLDYGKKIGMSFRDRGRKYLEKGRLGSLLNREGAEGQPHQ